MSRNAIRAAFRRLAATLAPVALLAIALLAIGGCAPSAASKPPTVPAAIAAQPISLPPPPAADYVLRPGDMLQVRLFEHPELAELLPIRPDGKISLQLVGDVVAAGQTPAELTAALTSDYARTLRNPSVAVIVKEAAKSRIYVAGEVNVPGLLEVADSMTALQAIFQAGGPKDSAELHNVVLLRYQGTKEPQYQTLDLKGDLKTADARHDLVLRPYDLIFVPKTRIASMNQFVREYVTQLVPATLTLGVTYFFGLR